MTTLSPSGAGLPLSSESSAVAASRVASSGWFVKLTHQEIVSLSKEALLLLAQWRQRSYRDANYVRHSYADLQEWCGWQDEQVKPESLDRRTGRAVEELVAAGLISRKKCFVTDLALSVPTYRVNEQDPATSGLWEKLPLHTLDQVMTAAQDSEFTAAELLQHWLAWRMACGRQVSTQVPVGVVASVLGCSPRRAGALRRSLHQQGLLFIVEQQGRPSTVSTQPLIPTRVEDAGQNDRVTAQASEFERDAQDSTAEAPPSILSGDPCISRPVTPVDLVLPIEERDLPLETVGDAGVGPQGRNSDQTREHATAGKPPNTPTQPAAKRLRGCNNDPHAWAARRLINRQPLLSDAPIRLRLQLINLLAKRSRLAVARGQGFDWALISERVAERFSEAEGLDALVGHEADLVREALAGLRADQLAADVGALEADAGSLVGDLDRTDPVPPAPTGITLGELADQDLPVIVDDVTLVEARAIELARMTHEALVQDPNLDVNQHLAHVAHALRGMPGQELVRMFSLRKVQRAYEQSLIAAEYRAWMDSEGGDIDPEIMALAWRSLTEASRSAAAA